MTGAIVFTIVLDAMAKCALSFVSTQD